MEIPKNIFRGYDIRGIYPTEINREVARKIGLGFATWMKNEGETQIIVGHDNRKSYEDIYAGLSEGILETGMNIIDIGFLFVELLLKYPLFLHPFYPCFFNTK